MEYDKYEEDEDRRDKARAQAKLMFREFDCPTCNANNPVEDPFTGGAEIQCNYCGTEFRTTVTEEGKLRLKEI